MEQASFIDQMSSEIVLTLLILLGAVVLFVTERIRLDSTALPVLAALALVGHTLGEAQIHKRNGASMVAVLR